MDMPLISVIVPVYNVEKYLDRCLQSITEQTYRNLEIILVDDGSPDNSGAICDAWAEKDSRINVIHKTNAGAGAARNTGLEVAKGELIGFVDSDDYIAPHMYEHLYSLMDENIDIAECEYVSTVADDVVFDLSSQISDRYTPEAAMLCHVRDMSAFRQLIWNKLYRRSVLEQVKFPVGTRIDDEFFTYQAIGNARNLIHSNQVCYAYRQQGGSIMHTLRSPQKYDAIQAKQLRLEYLRNHIPQLEYEAKLDLLLTCLYAMQDCVRYLKGQELTKARMFLHSTWDALMPFPIRNELSVKKKILLTASKLSLETTAKALNFLIDIHILS